MVPPTSSQLRAHSTVGVLTPDKLGSSRCHRHVAAERFSVQHGPGGHCSWAGSLPGWDEKYLPMEESVSVYKVIEIIGTSTTSWEDAAVTAVKTAGTTVRDLRVAEVVKQDLDLDKEGGPTFRVKLQISFKYEG